MKADREQNRLPLPWGSRCCCCRWRSCSSGLPGIPGGPSGDDPEQKLAEAGAKMSATSASTSAPGRSLPGPRPGVMRVQRGDGRRIGE